MMARGFQPYQSSTNATGAVRVAPVIRSRCCRAATPASIVGKILAATRAPAAFVTEGGYDLDALGACILRTIDEIEARKA